MLDGFGMAGAARSCKLAGVLALFHLQLVCMGLRCLHHKIQKKPQKQQKPSDKRHLRVIPAFVRIQRKTPSSENCRSRDDPSNIDQTKTGSSNNQWESKEKGLFNLRSQPSHLFKGNDENHHTTVHHNSKSVKNHKTVMQHENITKPWLRAVEAFQERPPNPSKTPFPDFQTLPVDSRKQAATDLSYHESHRGKWKTPHPL